MEGRRLNRLYGKNEEEQPPETVTIMFEAFKCKYCSKAVLNKAGLPSKRWSHIECDLNSFGDKLRSKSI